MTNDSKRRLFFNQLLIVAVTGYLYFYDKADLARVATLFALMQFGSLLGTWLGHRLQKRMIVDRDKLPLDRR